MSIDVDFLPDVTFLTGLNGSGKTSCLRLLMGLLKPNLPELASIDFVDARATVTDQGRELEVYSHRSSEALVLGMTGVEDTLTLSPAELQLLSDPRRREELPSPVETRVREHPVFQAIRELSTPMFLGLDRRFYSDPTDIDVRRRRLLMQRMNEDRERGPSTAQWGLLDVSILVADAQAAIRKAQEQLDGKLRNQILLGAFQYIPTEISRIGRFPSSSELKGYRERQAAIGRAAASLNLPVTELQQALVQFLDRMQSIGDALEHALQPPKRPKKRAIEPPKEFAEWLTNKAQADRILQHIQLLEQYTADRARLHEPIDRFLSLVNGFLNQTNKTICLNERGQLAVRISPHQYERSINSLSSGERQLVVMIAHLSLNKDLSISGVFIVDEPELSLHIAWQEKFVDAIVEANSNVQLILATHSPAIILDRTDNCRDLDCRTSVVTDGDLD